MSIQPSHAADVPPKRDHRRHAFRLILVIAAIAGCAFVWDEFCQDRLIPKRWQVVYPGTLYRSGQLSSALVQRTLENHEIRVVVDLTGPVPGDPDQQGELEACRALGIEHTRFPLKGNGTGDIRQYAAAVARIHSAIQQGEPVLVHCSAGVQRTGGVLAAYQLLVRGVSPADVQLKLTQRGFGRHPVNPGILTYLDANMQELADLLVREGTLTEPPSPLPYLVRADADNVVRTVARTMADGVTK